MNRRQAGQIWDDTRFLNLETKYRLLYLYIRDRCNRNGIWIVNAKEASEAIGVMFQPKRAAEALSELVFINGDKKEWRLVEFMNIDDKDETDESNTVPAGVYEFAIKVVTDLNNIHPQSTPYSHAQIYRMQEILCDLIEQGYDLEALKKAHEFAINDRVYDNDKWQGWKLKYVNPGNWLKKSRSGELWIQIWLRETEYAVESTAKFQCLGCGKKYPERRYINLGGICKSCEKDSAEREHEDRLRVDPEYAEEVKRKKQEAILQAKAFLKRG